MSVRGIFCFVFFFITFSCAAQVPFYTVLDTAEMREMREKNIHFFYRIDQPYDSVKGKPNKQAPIDTMFSEYDRMGREICFSYLNAGDRTRAYVRLYVNEKGQVIRRFSYDVDSTNGFLDYWNYNEKGQVIRESSKTRQGPDEKIFSAEEFVYNDTGALVKTRSYFVDDFNEQEPRGHEDFYYSGGLEISISFNQQGDSAYIDTVANLHNDMPYWSRRYRYMRKDENGSNRKMLVSETRSHYDTINGVQRQTYYYQRYNYSTGEPENLSLDTAYYDMRGKVIEFRDERNIQKYFYSEKGELMYMMCYNRQMQPLFKRTEVYQYYK